MRTMTLRFAVALLAIVCWGELLAQSGVLLPATATSNQYLHILSTGQSLALGLTAVPSLSNSQPYNNLTLSPGLYGAPAAPLMPLVEMFNWESPSSGLANTLHVLDTLARPVVIGMHASGGALYTDLKKGTAPWIRAMDQVTITKAEVDAMGGGAEYVPAGVTVVHGEADNNVGNALYYQGFLEEWQADYENDISQIVGHTVNFPMFVSQMNTGWRAEMAVAQYRAHKANPGKIFLIGPKYQYSYSDDLHLNNFESQHLGEMFAKVINEVVLKGNTWSPLMPTSVIRIDNIITVDFHIPVGSLVIDTTSLPQRPHYGFEFAQQADNTIEIVDVQLINNNTQVEITLNAIPTGEDQVLRYAYTCYHGGTGYSTCGNSEDSSAVGGNLRDMDSLISPAIGSTGIPLYNFCVAFEEPVIERMNAVQVGENQLLDIFPNPVQSQLQVHLRDGADYLAEMVLYDLTGREVKHWHQLDAAQQVTLDLGDIVRGAYLLHIATVSGTQSTHQVVVE